jgi:hypothetical protein
MTQRRTIALLLTLLLAMPTVLGAAQAAAPATDFGEEIPGIQAGIWRTYLPPDASSTMTAADAATLSPVSIEITIASFDTAESAEAFFDVASDDPPDFEADAGQGVVSQDQANRTNDTQSLYRQRLGQGNERTHGYEQVILQQDDLVVIVTFQWELVYQEGVDAPDDLAVPDAIEPLAAQILASDPAPAPERFAADGSSTGGLWEAMPVNGDPLLLGLVAATDFSIFPPADDQGTMPVDQLPGIESAVIRSYTPVDESAAIADLGTLAVGVYRFATPDDAAAAYDLLVANVTDEFRYQSEFEGNSLVTAELAGIGERATQLRVDAVFAQGYQSQEHLLTLDDTYVFTVLTVTGGPPTPGGTPVAISLSSAAAINLAMSLVANGEPSPDDVIFAEDATSTGGDWGFMPAAGDPLLHGLYPTLDQHLYPADPSGS